MILPMILPYGQKLIIILDEFVTEMIPTFTPTRGNLKT